MIYDGYDFSNLLTVEAVNRSLLPDLTVETTPVPGMDGSYFGGVSVGGLVIEVEARMIACSDGVEGRKAAFEALRREIAGRLLRRKPCDLVVDDAPDVSYQAILSGSTGIDRFLHTGGVTLQFECQRPYGEGRTVERVASPSQSEDGTEADPAVVRVNVGGNYPTAPVVTFPGDEAAYQAEFDGAVFSVYCRAGAGELVVDCARRKAYQGPYPATVDINCEWPEWYPGVHSVQSNDAFTVEWTERWA